MDGRRENYATEPLRVVLLGRFSVSCGDRIAAFRTRKTASLFAYLAFYVGLPLDKANLAATFWPESDGDRSRQSLRMALSAIRASLEAIHFPATCIRSDNADVVLSAEGVTVDVHRLREALARAEAHDPASHLAEALDEYGGPLLPGYTEEWIVPQMLELEELYAKAVADFVAHELDRRDFGEAQARAVRAISLYPQREDLHLALVRCHAAAGHTGLAVRQFEALERMLDDQWGEAPSAEAYALLEAMPRGGSTGSVSKGAKPVTRSEPLGAFFGRQAELNQVMSLLDPSQGGPRLITLTGLGGTGKTRLAEQLALAAERSYGQNVWFFPLEACRRAEEAIDQVAQTLGATGSNPTTAVAARLAASNALLILDNLEQLFPEIGHQVEELLAVSPKLRILATSRIPLGLPAERCIPINPLPIPHDFRKLDELRVNPSVQILVDSAQHVRPGFAVTAANSQSVATLCQRLEGIPLAIELAASHLGTKTPTQVLASLGRRADLSSTRTHDPRRRNVSEVIEWTVEQLSPQQREAFGRLGVCEGGFTAELAEAILGSDYEALLGALGKASLISWQESPDEVRFAMLETVREVALAQIGEGYTPAVEAHFSFVERIMLESDSTPTEWGRAVDRERANILAALGHGTRGEIEPARTWDLALRLEAHIDRQGHPARWIGTLDDLLRATESHLDEPRAAKANLLVAKTAYSMRDIRTAFRCAKQSMDLADRTNDPVLRASPRPLFGITASLFGDHETAERELRTAVDLLDDRSASPVRVRAHLDLGWVYFNRGDDDLADEILKQGVNLAGELGDKSLLATCLVAQGCAVGSRDYAQACQHFDRAAAIWREDRKPDGLALSHYYRAIIDLRNGQADVALANVRAAFRLYAQHGIALGQTPLTVAGNAHAASGIFDAAEAYWLRSEAVRRRQGLAMFPTIRRDFDRELAHLGLSEGALWARVDELGEESDHDFLERVLPPVVLNVS